MKRLFWRLAPEMVFCLGIVGVLGCDPSNGLPAGPPVLQSFSVIDNLTSAPLDLTADGSPVQITGYVHLNALFDRLLDPTTVTAVDGGVDNGSTDAVSGTYAPLPPTSVTLTSIYTPNGDAKLALFFAPGPSITTMAAPTFPSNSTVTVTLNRTKIRSKKGEPFVDGDTASTIMFQTAPFSAAITVPMGDADPDAGADAGTPAVSPMMQPVSITFTNLPADDIAAHISIIANGTPITTGITSAIDKMTSPTTITFTPDTAWPANATIEVRIDATAADAVNVPIDAPASASFTTSAS